SLTGSDTGSKSPASSTRSRNSRLPVIVSSEYDFTGRGPDRGGVFAVEGGMVRRFSPAAWLYDTTRPHFSRLGARSMFTTLRRIGHAPFRGVRDHRRFPEPVERISDGGRPRSVFIPDRIDFPSMRVRNICR